MYGNDLEKIESASLKVHNEDYDLLLAFASLFDTSLINAEDVQQWISEYNPENGYVTKEFGDAEFNLNGDVESGTTELSIFALE